MARSFLDKVLSWIGFDVDEEVEAEVAAAKQGPSAKVAQQWVEEMPHGGKKRGALVNLPGQKQVRVVVVEPRSFEEVQSIADHLKARRPIILNLENTDREHAQRVLNFLSGTIYALDGEMQRISNGIFFFAPNNIDVALMRRSLRPGEGGEGAVGRAADPLLGGEAKRSGLNLAPLHPAASQRPQDDTALERTLPLWHK